MDFMDGKKEILISDLSVCEPQSAIADHGSEGCWWKTDYELENGVKGVMLNGEPQDAPVRLSLKLNARGFYKIYIGINYLFQPYKNGHRNRLVELDYGAVSVRLSNDRGFTRVGIEKYLQTEAGRYPEKVLPEKATKEHFNAIYESYWKTADLTGQDLVISAPGEPYNNPYYRQVANISYLRLVPASREDISFEERLLPDRNTKNLVVIWCTGALTGHTSGQTMYHPTDRQWFETEFEHFRKSDVEILCFEAMRGNLCCFRTVEGDVGTYDKSWRPEWLNPLEEFTKLGHEAGIKVFASLRLIGGSRPYNRYPINWARFFWEHPEWAKRDKEGNMCGNSSIAFEGVRKHWLKLLEEALELGIDGIQLHLNRASPFVMYEEPVVKKYMELYGVDPRTETDDKRWKRHTASYMTQFIREIRELLDKKPGRQLSVTVAGYEEFKPGEPGDGVDTDTLASEGLVDYVFLFDKSDARYINYFKNLGKGRVKVYFELMPRTQPGEQYVSLAESLYEKGADGFTLWDCERRVQRASEWAVAKHLGHKSELSELKERAKDYYRMSRIKLHKGLNVKFSYKDG
jgi:hypothetical protein